MRRNFRKGAVTPFALTSAAVIILILVLLLWLIWIYGSKNTQTPSETIVKTAINPFSPLNTSSTYYSGQNNQINSDEVNMVNKSFEGSVTGNTNSRASGSQYVPATTLSGEVSNQNRYQAQQYPYSTFISGSFFNNNPQTTLRNTSYSAANYYTNSYIDQLISNLINPTPTTGKGNGAGTGGTNGASGSGSNSTSGTGTGNSGGNPGTNTGGNTGTGGTNGTGSGSTSGTGTNGNTGGTNSTNTGSGSTNGTTGTSGSSEDTDSGGSDENFGGKITFVLNCTCGISRLLYIDDVRDGTKALLFTPGESIDYDNHNTNSPGATVLGLYSSGGTCSYWVGEDCIDIDADGTIDMIGSSAN